jgi:cytochrome b561
MHVRNTKKEYGLVAKILHWQIAVTMIGLIGIGWYTSGLDNESVLYWRLLDLHEAVGLSLFVVFPLKIVWTVVSPHPEYLPTMAVWERTTATIVRWLLISAVLVIPLSGFLYVATNGEAVRLYNLITIPDLGELPERTRERLSDVHYYGSYGCAALIVIHIMAALKHHFIDRNTSLRRMTF